jgi:hypothetical protein
VAVSSLDDYLRDKKLRIMVLRPRSDLPQLREAPMLPHQAAESALREARERHVPYDFEMDYEDPDKKFCSEVASAAYRDQGLSLWRGLTSMSTPGVARWLSALGVTHFVTHGPSDLEYDPQVVVVAEWRDPQALFDDHVDNAVVDAMLEGAEEGDELELDQSALPLGRIAKGYSSILNLFGLIGPVPEGMGAATALRVRKFTEDHRRLKARVLARVDRFQRARGHRPPYWELVRLSQEARQNP